VRILHQARAEVARARVHHPAPASPAL
jgi:hypothetical protein